MHFSLTLAPRRGASLSLSEGQTTPEEFLKEDLQPCPVGTKDGPAVIPAVFNPCPSQCRNHGTDRVDCGGGKFHRLGANVRATTAFGVDLDALAPGQLDLILTGLQARGLGVLWWETFSSTPEKPKARLLIPFAKELPLSSPAQWSAGAWPALARELGLEGAAQADTACRDPARIYYLPRKPTPEAIRRSGYVPGAALDWAGILGDGPGGMLARFESAALEVAPVPVPSEDPTRPVDLEAIRATLAKRKSPRAQALAKGAALAPPPGARKPGDPSRYEAWREATAILSMVLEGWESTDAVLELCRPSWHAEVAESPDSPTDWATVVDLLGKARASAPKKKAEKLAEKQRKEKFWKDYFGRHMGQESGQEGPFAKTGQGTPGRDSGQEGPEPAVVEKHAFSGSGQGTPGGGGDGDWQSDLEMVERSDGTMAIRKTARNLWVILTRSPKWAGALRKDALRARPRYGPPGASYRDLKDADYTTIQLAVAEDTGVEFDYDTVRRHVRAVAELNTFDPLMDYLRSVQWDGEPRLDKMLEAYFGASLEDDDNRDRTRYVRAVSARWMIAAAARGLRPGCQADSALIFQGGQGKKKTSALRTLGGEFYVNFCFPMDSKDAQQAAGSKWIGELGELAFAGKTNVAVTKNFLTVTSDTLRPPYGENLVDRPRRIVFAGTTNEDEYLSDPTGNRRFWPVTVGDIDIDALRRDRDQLWAEAVARLNAGEQWHLTPEEEELAKPETDARMKDDPLADQIADWILCKEPAARPEAVRVVDVARGLGRDKTDKTIEMRIGPALLRLGFFRRRMDFDGRRTTVYATPGGLLNAPKKVRVVGMGTGMGGVQPTA